MQRQFHHSCTSCVLIGQTPGLDIYQCPQSGSPTLLGRHGDEGGAYDSLPVFLVDRTRSHLQPDVYAHHRRMALMIAAHDLHEKGGR